MSNFNGFFDDEWSGDLDDLEWNEFHWERYLREQDEQPHRYLAFYETLLQHPKRTDQVARLMGWAAWNRSSSDNSESADSEANETDAGVKPHAGSNPKNADTDAASSTAATKPAASPEQQQKPPPALKHESPDTLAPRPSDALAHSPPTRPPYSPDDPLPDFGSYYEVYTPQRNPLFISTRALYLRLRRTWELLASTPGKVSLPLAIRYLATLQRGEDQAMQAIQSLDCGEYALAISLFKRALASLNESHALLNEADTPAARSYAEEMRVSLFDLREIWLEVIGECRDEADYWLNENDDDED